MEISPDSLVIIALFIAGSIGSIAAWVIQGMKNDLNDLREETKTEIDKLFFSF